MRETGTRPCYLQQVTEADLEVIYVAVWQGRGVQGRDLGVSS